MVPYSLKVRFRGDVLVWLWNALFESLRGDSHPIFEDFLKLLSPLWSCSMLTKDVVSEGISIIERKEMVNVLKMASVSPNHGVWSLVEEESRAVSFAYPLLSEPVLEHGLKSLLVNDVRGPLRLEFVESFLPNLS